MTDTNLVCSVCHTVFSEHRGSANPVDPEEDQVQCPNCGSYRIEPDHFDPDEPIENPFEEPEEGHTL